jgi:hypothetical protein
LQHRIVHGKEAYKEVLKDQASRLIIQQDGNLTKPQDLFDKPANYVIDCSSCDDDDEKQLDKCRLWDPSSAGVIAPEEIANLEQFPVAGHNPPKDIP